MHLWVCTDYTFQETSIFTVVVCFHSLTLESVQASCPVRVAPYQNLTLKLICHWHNDVKSIRSCRFDQNVMAYTLCIAIDCTSFLLFYHYLFTYLLTPWSRVLLEKLTGFAANQEFPSILWNPEVHYRTHKRRHLSLSWANTIQSLQLLLISWRSILILSSHLRLGLPSGLFPSGFPTKTLCTPLPSSIRATCPAHRRRNVHWVKTLRQAATDNHFLQYKKGRSCGIGCSKQWIIGPCILILLKCIWFVLCTVQYCICCVFIPHFNTDTLNYIQIHLPLLSLAQEGLMAVFWLYASSRVRAIRVQRNSAV